VCVCVSVCVYKCIRWHACVIKLTVNCHCVCRVDEQKGLAVGKTYRNADQAQVFMHYIAEVERRKVKEEISATKFIDGSTDSSVMEEELVYTRMSRAGKVKVQFVGIQALKKADADVYSQWQRGMEGEASCLWDRWSGRNDRIQDRSCQQASWGKDVHFRSPLYGTPP